MTWNAQGFFDAIEDGSEFDEYKTSAGYWNADKYSERLDRLCDGILLCGKKTGMEPNAGPDIVVLDEIENERVVHDISNWLPQRSSYRHAAFVPPPGGSAFGCAILSRYPVKSVTGHTVAGGDQVLRPLLEAVLDVGGEELTVFAVHWKSKSGDTGDNDSRSARQAQEALLDARIGELTARYEKARLDEGGAAASEPGPLWLACGDFNQTRDEFSLLEKYRNCWDAWLNACVEGSIAGPAGSYFYRGNWETIDHFFVPNECADGSGWEAVDFAVVAESPLVDDGLAPVRYEVFTGKGYSDHLPLVLALEKVP